MKEFILGLTSSFVILVLIGFYFDSEFSEDYIVSGIIVAVILALPILLIQIKLKNITKYKLPIIYFLSFLLIIAFVLLESILGIDLEDKILQSMARYKTISDYEYISEEYGSGYISENNIKIIYYKNLKPYELIYALNSVNIAEDIIWHIENNGNVSYSIDQIEHQPYINEVPFWESEYLKGYLPVPKKDYSIPNTFLGQTFKIVPIYFLDRFVDNMIKFVFVGLSFAFIKRFRPGVFFKGDKLNKQK